MNKQEFLEELRRRLGTLPEEDINRSCEYYSESIDDRMEDGMTEEEAVQALGDVREITYAIMDEVPMKTIVQTRVTQREGEASANTSKAWKWIALIVTSPVWLSLLFAAVVVLLSFYLALLCIMFSFLLVAIIVPVSGVIAIIAGCFFGFTQGLGSALTAIGSGFFCVGLGMLMWKPCWWCIKKVFGFTKSILGRIKYRFFAPKGVQSL